MHFLVGINYPVPEIPRNSNLNRTSFIWYNFMDGSATGKNPYFSVVLTVYFKMSLLKKQYGRRQDRYVSGGMKPASCQADIRFSATAWQATQVPLSSVTSLGTSTLHRSFI